MEAVIELLEEAWAGHEPAVRLPEASFRQRRPAGAAQRLASHDPL